MIDQVQTVPEQEKRQAEHIGLLQNKLWGHYQSLTNMAEDLLCNRLMNGYPEHRHDRWTVVAAVRMLEPYPMIMDVAKFRILNRMSLGLPEAA